MAIAGTFDLASGKLVVGRLQLLQTDDIRLRFFHPAQQNLEATVDALTL
jgi:hypothetical protein